MGMTAARLRERRAVATAALPPAKPQPKQETDAERIGRLRAENAALRARVSELESLVATMTDPQAKPEAKAQEPEPRREPETYQQRDFRGPRHNGRRG